jgi:hypothetical protein
MRQRSSAIAITQNTKKRMSNEIGLDDNMLDEVRKEKLTNYLEEKFKNDTNNNFIKSNKKDDYHVTDIPPPYLDIRKEYYTKGEKVSSHIN